MPRSVPLRDEAGNIVKWYGSAFDIEDRKRVEEQLRHAQADLARVTRMAAIAHEVNQPLGAVVTNGSASLRWLAGHPPNLEEAKLTAVVCGSLQGLHTGRFFNSPCQRQIEFHDGAVPHRVRCG
jgi:hypothetical protein